MCIDHYIGTCYNSCKYYCLPTVGRLCHGVLNMSKHLHMQTGADDQVKVQLYCFQKEEKESV